VTVANANAIWHRPGMDLDPGFVQRIGDAFGGSVRAVDFGDEDAAAEIDEWLKAETGGTIGDLVADLDPATVLLLVNAVYFDGKWTRAFDEDRTVPGTFTLADGSTETVPFMSGETELRVGRTDAFDAVEVSYGGQAFAMTLLRPRAGYDVLDVARDLDAQAWAGLTTGLEPMEATLELPRFELSCERVLNGDLAGIDMNDAFDPARADFTRMVSSGGIWIDQVRQKSFIAVDEAGTVAAAATAVDMVGSAGLPVVRVDRPFLFAVRERLTGTILFLGILQDPGA
jgi:serpin B